MDAAATTAAASNPTTTPEPFNNAVKRKRSPSVSSMQSAAAPSAKKTSSSSHLSINYLARQSQEDLSLINKDDTLPNLLSVLSGYSAVLDRHESLASNLGARPLGPILIKRFERCFDAPPKIVASHHKGTGGSSSDATTDTHHNITWLEVIEFARAHPSQFTLSTFSEGSRVCQFYYPQKQLRVQISEEDFLFINSGRCQELIPPLPIWEDEEKEVGTCDVLEAKLKELTNIADMVAARTRQLSHRLKNRKTAIFERRAEGGSGTPAKLAEVRTTTAPGSFVAVNSSNGKAGAEGGEPSFSSSAAVRSELLRHFESLPHNQNFPSTHGRTQSRYSISNGVGNDIGGSGGGRLEQGSENRDKDTHIGTSHHRTASNESSLSPVPPNFPNDVTYYTSNEASRQAALNYPTSYQPPTKHNFSRPLPPALESSQPFRPLCQAHMDSLPRGTRVLPPCDRCRRLRMDCLKNLTSCAGCTKKHARCHWKEVTRDELGALDHIMDNVASHSPSASANGYLGADYSSHASSPVANGSGGGKSDEEEDYSEDDDSNPLEDLEALGAKEEKEDAEWSIENEEQLQAGEAAALASREELRVKPATNDNTIVAPVVDGSSGTAETGIKS